MTRTPNLATRPFVNERLPALLMVLALVALGGVTVQHAFVLSRLLPSRTAVVESEVRSLERELAALREEGASLPRPTPEARVLTEWEAIVFSWALLFARLEDVLPPGIRLASIAPTTKDGRTMVEIGAVGRTITDGFEFMKALEASADFGDVIPSSVGQVDSGEGGGQIQYRMQYTPTAPRSPAPTPEKDAPEPPDAAGAP
jgi:hypothetical protein